MMQDIIRAIGVVAGVALVGASWFVAQDYAPAVSALLLWME